MRSNFNTIIILFFLISCFNVLLAQDKGLELKWNDLQFLEGKWKGEGKGNPGQGSGYFTFSYDLSKNIFVRKNHSEISSTDGKIEQIHDDLLIIYKLANGKIKAIYFDNENHVINYDVFFSKEKNQIVFLSEILPSFPRYRLVYTKLNDEKLKTEFDIAKPGSPEVFSNYLEGISYKDK